MAYLKVSMVLAYSLVFTFIYAQAPINFFKLKGKCGYKNVNGEIIVPAEYDECRDCFLGPDFKIVISGGEKNTKISKGWDGGKWGVVHSSGKIIVPVEYDYISYLREDVPDIIMTVSEGKYSFYDSTGKVVLPIADKISLSDYAKSISFSEANYYVRGFIPYKLNNKYGVVDFKGNNLIEPTCECISNFSDKYGKSNEQNVFSCNGKLGVLYSNGTVLLPVFDAFYEANEGGKMIISDFKSSKKLECSFSLLPNSTPRFIYGTIGDTVYLFNQEGKQIPIEFLQKSKIVNDKFIISEINGKYGVLDNNGEVFIPYKYDDISYVSTNETFPKNRKIIFLAREEEKWGAFNGDDGREIAPFVYDELKANYQNKYCATFAGKKGSEWILFDAKHDFKCNWIAGDFVDDNRGWGISKSESNWIYLLDGNCKLDYRSKSGTTSKTPDQIKIEKMAEQFKQERLCPTCYHCNGSGLDPKKEYKLVNCYVCNGKPRYTVRYGYGSNATYKEYSCGSCMGGGKQRVKADKKPCYICNGKGCIQKD